MSTVRFVSLFLIAVFIGASLTATRPAPSVLADEYTSSSSSAWSSSADSSESTSWSSSSNSSGVSSSESSSSTSSSSETSSSSSEEVSSPSSNTSCNLSTACVVNGLADKIPGADLNAPKDPATDWEAMRTQFANQGDLGLSVLYYNVACPAGCVRGAMINDPCEPNARKYDAARADLSEYQQPTTQAYGCRAP